jgi:6-phosphogluconolactonase (cycloisomerase 2 family)
VNGFNIEGFTIDTATGLVTHMPLIDYPESGRASNVIVDRSGRYVYSLDNSLQAVWEFSVDAATGFPTPIRNSPYILSDDGAGAIGPVGFASSH